MASTQGASQPPHDSNNQDKSVPSQTTEKHIRDNVVKLLFELLRNADAKAYSECAARKESPSITFKIYPKQITIDCNEDGLTKLDLDAICRLDPRAASFASIVVASKKVHYQSGYFSFEFERNGDEVKNKMKPVWVAPIEDVPEALTRMTLYLHDEADDKGLQCLRDTILSQFEQLSGTSLLFLKKLQRITVEFYNTDDKPEKSKHFRKAKLDDCRVSIEGISILEGRQTTHSQIYHVAEQPAKSLATNVVLAFSLDKDYKPRICREQKEVCNILPITATKYNFHIHADFDLESDRRNLIATSKRNLELRDLIVDAFHNALDSFWRHPTLCYDWPTFLPSLGKNGEVFWNGLDTLFQEKSSYVVVECRRDSMRTMQDAMFLPDSMRDKDDQPLLDDSDNDLFISSNYSKNAVEALKNHGLNTMGFDAVIALLEEDLKREDSKMKAKDTSNDWHSRMADLLSIFANSVPSHIETLRGLPLVPLQNGYFNTWGDLPIDDLVSCLNFLEFAHTAPWDYKQEQLYDKVQVMDMNLRRIKPRLKAIYLLGTDHPYSPESLLPADRFPDFFLHRKISEADLSPVRIFTSTWKEWLCRSVGVRRELSLLPEIGVKQFEILEHIYKYRPDKFLGFLKYRWAWEGAQLKRCQALILFLRDFPAKNICVGELPVKLKDTWIPDRDLEMIVKRYVDDLSQFPFLKIEMADTSRSVKVEWRFLTENILKKKDQDMALYIELVESMKRLCVKDVSDSQFYSVVDLYSEIDSILAGSGKRRYERALQFFDDSGILYIDDDGPLWTGSSSCLWAAPPDMITSYSLESFFIKRACNPQQMETLERLFHKKLDIRNATLDDLVTELVELRNAGCEDVPRIVGIYTYLDEKLDEWSELRLAFQESALLFQISDACPTWKKTADFVWVHDEAGTELAASYTKLKRFFIIKLGVKVSSEEILKSPPNSVEEAKEVLVFLNDALDVHKIWKTDQRWENTMFPVRYPDGRVLLENVDSNLLIGDHEGLKARLQSKVKLLDLGLCEVRRLSSLFWNLGPKVRHLSSEVMEITSVVAIDESPVLLGSDIITSEAVLGTACAHIAEAGGKLTVYVPKNAKAQDICYLSRLPKAFALWLEPWFYNKAQVVKLLSLVFATDKCILDDILDDHGIMQLSFEDEDTIENESSDGEEEYYDVKEPKRPKDHTLSLNDDGKDTRKADLPRQDVFNLQGLQSALKNLDKADESLPRKGGLFGDYIKG
ncbi:hypothetical protein ACHAP5_005035 [Fusarium lateritium]